MGLSLKQRVGLELQRSLRKTNEQLHPLRTLFWECTLRCNMSCRHCGSDCKVAPSVPDMPAADFLKVIDSITPHVDPHKVFIIFTGGEALLRDDLEQVGLELYRREYPWGVVTNGFLLDEKRLESLLASGMHSITISLDGFEQQHNWIRRHPQSFEKATQAIELLTRHKDLLWDIVTCVNPQNYPYLSKFKEYLVSLGVPAWRLFSIFPMGRAANDPELQLTDEQFRGILDFIKECREDDSRLHVSYACEGFLGEYEQKVRDHFFYCRSGVGGLDTLRRRHQRLHLGPQPHGSRQYLPRRLLGCVAEPLPSDARPLLDQERPVQGLQGLALLRGLWSAPIRRPGKIIDLPL